MSFSFDLTAIMNYSNMVMAWMLPIMAVMLGLGLGLGLVMFMADLFKNGLTSL